VGISDYEMKQIKERVKASLEAMSGWVYVFQVQIVEISRVGEELKVSGSFRDYSQKEYKFTVTLDKSHQIVEAKILQ
jgi:hypothetical protein